MQGKFPLTTRQTTILQSATTLAKNTLENEGSGHDWWHIYRVTRLSKKIAVAEGANLFICELAALLHDLIDEKLFDDPEAEKQRLQDWMLENEVTTDEAAHVMEIITTLSFKGGAGQPMTTLEGEVVQDADRLDAIGAIGIARTFVYSGKKGRPMYDPNVPVREEMTPEQYRDGKDTAINHFYEKLLKLQHLLNTDAGRKIAQQRHTYMEQFLRQFKQEWDGLDGEL
ncbi:HD domain-containing protein [Saccharibacillus sp. JS10]|uniref:HD domain-containing protein n=1 Tax=Saccharibacillus sp. JS10 TaxID=2950552 RepID=UPI00210E8D4A|nr:HD domain-containing protein [Saccharibacillus sp. JS10]MCQ4087070.1 HD domain-containing protein [Saccharibacillus sp. JS10]